jgi:hypothetical protein
MGVNFCPQCLEKQRRIDQLEEEVRRLKQKLHYRERQAAEGPFGSSTPSARRPCKANASEEQRAKGGALDAGIRGMGARRSKPAKPITAKPSRSGRPVRPARGRSRAGDFVPARCWTPNPCGRSGSFTDCKGSTARTVVNSSAPQRPACCPRACLATNSRPR